MTLAVEAVVENGVLKPLNPLCLEEHQKVHLLVQTDAVPSVPARKRWHWQQAQAIDDGFTGEIAEGIDSPTALNARALPTIDRY